MKKLLGLLFVFAALIISCKKEGLLNYEDGSGIYFDNREIQLDTMEVAWGLKNSEVQSQKLTLKVNLIGQVADYDREFELEILDDNDPSKQAKLDVDYKEFPLKHTIKAGEASTTIDIELLRNPQLLEENRHLTVALKEGGDLQFIYSRTGVDSEGEPRKLDYQRVLKLTENFPIPRWWGVYGNSLFGTWSVAKSILICDMMDIDRELWVSNLYTEEHFTEGLLRYAGVYIHRWLQEQDPVILDEDGEPMEMGPQSKR